ncbi:MAG: hypothetical protein KDE53_08155 [Caldilineaceae bacterium]|nr:hypothetical protein [Caldilineaceae bacterium]
MTISLEQVQTTTLLGIRFWDPAREAQITDGLTVTVTPVATPYPSPVTAFRTASGIYAFQGIAGLRALEHGPATSTSPPFTLRYQLQVTDAQQRFLPTVADIELPLSYRGLYRPGATGSPPDEDDDAATRFYLFSAPTRTPPPGLAVVRAQLYDQLANGPAAFALLEVQTPLGLWFGLSAANGSAAVILPYPTFTRSLENGSPPPLVAQQQWPLTVRIYYEPAVQSFSNGQAVPDLGSIRRQQQAQSFATAEGPPANEQTGQLIFETETHLATAGLSHLLVAPASSP